MTVQQTKPSYEELEAEHLKLKARFHGYCRHDGGKMLCGNGKKGICGVCGWDLDKCQHRKADVLDKYCRECGEELTK